ncbi:prolyl 3-hydroxylase OGFOD1 isoform X2 [Alosa sapidissima]|uniref:prolyl 3-hydroxylase OGFOD1 isoform X2 n=1 Tax=Alosa sapidissima TaxID=34773 RepID=UPI001C098A20|nr:prolyl 3-hydroxylase OGFOD1 isoform X2 [Alosa sapidissima]
MSCKRKQNDRTSPSDVKKEKHWHVNINNSLLDASTKTALQKAWKERTSCRHGYVELDCNPFPHCVINQFLSTEDFVFNLEKELSQLNFHSKSNDLYKFTQSADLNDRMEPCITELRLVLLGQFRTWLSELLDVELEPTVDIFCAKYQHTDVLLCHDDELEGRRVAFILYLVPPWELCDGGTLDLFCTDEHGQPQCVVKSLVPSRNTLVFFEVSPVSFHQVSEVLSSEKCRMSLSGWFHGPSLPRFPQYIEPPALRHKYTPGDEKMLHKWINQEYMKDRYQIQVQQEFQENSEICLSNFLQKEKFQEVRAALQLAEIQWLTKGPANKRHYEYAELCSLPQCVQECWKLFSSEDFYLLLSNLSGLKLHPLAKDNDSSDDSEDDEEGTARRQDCEDKKGLKRSTDGTSAACVGEVRRWRHGSYTLLHDSESSREFGLDLLLTLGCFGWQQDSGGFTSYIAHGEDEELLTVIPEDNSLALVYRDTDTLKFVKYVNDRSSSHNHQEPPGTFYDFSFVYYE